MISGSATTFNPKAYRIVLRVVAKGNDTLVSVKGPEAESPSGPFNIQLSDNNGWIYTRYGLQGAVRTLMNIY